MAGWKRKFLGVALGLLFLSPGRLVAESQNSDYKGITDPFGDPANYEFAEDEKEDKEFFHLGRYLMFGLDFGAGVFTGGLGSTNDPAFYVGARLIYFFDKHLAMELAGHYASDLDSIPITTSQSLNINTTLVPINAGFRYYFETKDAPKAIALANPFLCLGGGLYLRSQTPISVPAGLTVSEGSTSSFGAYGGGGVEFAVYGNHVYLGVDLRFHLIFFPDEDQTFGGAVAQGSRSGDYFTAVAALTYNF